MYRDSCNKKIQALQMAGGLRDGHCKACSYL